LTVSAVSAVQTIQFQIRNYDRTSSSGEKIK